MRPFSGLRIRPTCGRVEFVQTATAIIPCGRCGRPVRIERGDAAVVVCSWCAPLPSTLMVLRDGRPESVPVEEVGPRLERGDLRSTDLAVAPDGTVLPLGAHPSVRDLVLRVAPRPRAEQAPVAWTVDAPRPAPAAPSPAASAAPSPAAPAAPSPAASAAPSPAASKSAPTVAARVPQHAVTPRRRLPWKGLVAVAVLAGAGAAAWSFRPSFTALTEVSADALETAVAPQAPVPAFDPVAALVARVGAVDTPRNQLLAEAWAARSRGTAEGTAAAARLAERAVARLPQDVEALALLAELYADEGGDLELRIAALERARTAAPRSSAVLRADAWIAWREGRRADAATAAQACLGVDPTNLPCRLVAVLAADPARPAAERLAEADALLAEWPEAPELVAHAARVAADGRLPGAWERLVKAARARPDDRPLQALYARELVARGEPDAAERIARRLGADAPVELRLVIGRDALARGQADRVVEWLGGVDRAVLSPDAVQEIELRLAQARYQLARGGDPAAVAAALTAADAVLAAASNDPAAVQVATLAQALAGDRARAARTAATLDPSGQAGRDRSRAWLARASVEVALGLPRDADTSLERALGADSRAPELHLWRVHAAVLGQDPARAVAVLRQAVGMVDGADARRAPIGRTLPVPADVVALRRLLDEALAGRDPQSEEVVRSLATVDWLAGDVAAARRRLDGLPADADDAATLALRARLLLAQGDARGAVGWSRRALERDPGEAAWGLLLGQALYATGQLAEAEAALAVVRGAGGRSSLALSLRSEIAEARGDLVAARAHAREAVAADPDDLLAAARLARLGP